MIARAATNPHRVSRIDIAPWLAAFAARHPTLDLRGQAAFAMGRLAFDLGRHLALAALVRGQTPLWPPEAMTPVLESYRDAAHGEVDLLRFRFEIAGEVAWTDASSQRLAQTVEAVAAPVVAALAAASRLSAGALWRLAADGLASGILYVGREEERVGAALALGRAALAAAPRLARLGADYRHVAIEADPETGAAALERWFLRRSGCCRWYTAGEGQEKCGTCVLLSADEQHARLSAYLRDEALAAATSGAAS